MIIPEFYHIAQRAFSKKDPRELNFSNKKEITEYITERRRLNQFYRDTLRLIGADLKNYIERKRFFSVSPFFLPSGSPSSSAGESSSMTSWTLFSCNITKT